MKKEDDQQQQQNEPLTENRDSPREFARRDGGENELEVDRESILDDDEETRKIIKTRRKKVDVFEEVEVDVDVEKQMAECFKKLSVKKTIKMKIKAKLEKKKEVAKMVIKKKVSYCPDCTYKTDRSANYKRHIRTMHLKEIDVECCGIRFKSKADRSKHRVLVHGKGYKCSKCEKLFDRRALLLRHDSVHTGEKPFKCEDCSYSTSHKSNLNRHRKDICPVKRGKMEREKKLKSNMMDDDTSSSSIVDVVSTPPPPLTNPLTPPQPSPTPSTQISTDSDKLATTPRPLSLDETLRLKGPLKYFQAKASLSQQAAIPAPPRFTEQALDLSSNNGRLTEPVPQHFFPTCPPLLGQCPVGYYSRPQYNYHPTFPYVPNQYYYFNFNGCYRPSF